MGRKREIRSRWFDQGWSTSFARTSGVWQSRSGQRNREFSSFGNMLGLNTASDDLHKRDGESPYLRNVRFMGEKQTTQRAQVTARSGARFLHSVGNVTNYPSIADGQTSIELHEGKTIEFDIELDELLVGGSLIIKNTGGAKGALRVLLKESATERPLCDAIIDLEKVSSTKFQGKVFRFIQGVYPPSATIRLEILDDVEPEECQDFEPIRGRSIEILGTGERNHRTGDYLLPNTDDCMKEQPIEFSDMPGSPLFGTITNAYRTMPRGYQYCCEGQEYLIFPVINPEGGVELYRQKLPSNGSLCSFDTARCADEYNPGARPQLLNAPVDDRACAVRFEQAGGFIYYVDGFSPLQKIPVCGTKAQVVSPTADEIDTALDTDPATLKPKEGASLILKMRNRLYLSGFADDPNFVETSLIDQTGPQFDQFNDGFYSPDQTPEDSSCGPITALIQLENNLVVFRTNGNSVYTPNGGLLFGQPQQVDTFSWNMGTPNQETVTAGNGNIYFWNRSEGFRRFAGTDTAFRSVEIDNELRRIGPNDLTFMIAHANKVRFYFDRERRGYPDHCAVYHTFLSGSSPWYMDNQTPLVWAVGDQDSDTIYGMHSQYPATYIVDYTERNDIQFTDFNSSIPMEYSTNYISPGGLGGETLVRRAMVKVIANSTNSWFIGVDRNHEDNPSVWRKFVQGQVDNDNNDDAVFGNTAEAGSKKINISMNKRCDDVQLRILALAYRSQPEVLYAELEVGSKGSL